MTEHKPGFDLDKRVSEVVYLTKFCTCVKWNPGETSVYSLPFVNCSDCGNAAPYPPKFSTDPRRAFELLEQVASRGFGYCVERAPDEKAPTVWVLPRKNRPIPKVIVRFESDGGRHDISDVAEGAGCAATGPFSWAACRAVLLVLEEDAR